MDRRVANGVLENGASRGLLVFGVDDDSDHLALIAAMCRAVKLEFAGTIDAARAVEQIREMKPDIVLLDVMMPGIDGYSICRDLKSDPATTLIPVVILTAHGSRQERQAGMEAGCDEFMAKPVDLVELSTRVRSLGRQRQLTKRLAESNASLRQEIEAREEAENRLVAALEDLDHFAHVAAHDLKAPLLAMKRLASWIIDDDGPALSEGSRNNLSMLMRSADRLGQLVGSMLLYARHDPAAMEPEQVDVARLLGDVVDLMPIPEGFRVVVTGAMPTLVTYPDRLGQVFANLISNAVKYCGSDRGRVEIMATWGEGPLCEFRVADDGPGIEPRFHETIFEPFCKLERKEQVEGTGIGLALVRRTVMAHGGTIRVESAPGQGATFRFSWPLVDASWGGGAQERRTRGAVRRRR